MKLELGMLLKLAIIYSVLLIFCFSFAIGAIIGFLKKREMKLETLMKFSWIIFCNTALFINCLLFRDYVHSLSFIPHQVLDFYAVATWIFAGVWIAWLSLLIGNRSVIWFMAERKKF